MTVDSVSEVLATQLRTVLWSPAYRTGDIRALAEAHRLRKILSERFARTSSIRGA